jgi:S1-C subfamily serine protease
MRKCLLLFLLTLFLPPGQTAHASILTGQVVQVVSGDTLVIDLGGERKTYAIKGLASPVAGQPYWQEARAFTSELLLGKQVQLTPFFRPKDRTWVAEIMVRGRDIRPEILNNGYAWCYLTNKPWLLNAQKTAHKQRLGLWAGANPVRPWDFKENPTSVVVSGPAPRTNSAPVGVRSSSPSRGHSQAADAPVLLLTDNEQAAANYDGKAVLVKSKYKEVALLSSVAPKLPPSKYDDYLESVVVITTGDALGSGFFVDNRGHVITNNHVIKNASRLKISLRDGRTATARIVAVARDQDLALLQVKVESNRWLELGNLEDAGTGSDVMAIGAPEGLSWSVAKGIVSAVRNDPGFTIIQTDTAVNHGNSGGPLISLETGRVVGVNTFGLDKSVAEGLNFAIGVDVIRQVFAGELF